MAGDEADDATETTEILELTADIVASYVRNNTVAPSELIGLIDDVRKALDAVGHPRPEPAPDPPAPAVPVKKSVTPDYLISLEDGRRYKTLTRHLTGLGMTAAQYRQKWNLPADYPMTAASYSARRSELAKSLGLGRKRQPAPPPAPEPAPEPKRRGRAKKAG